ncbi:hypothetical protein EDC55_1232 [Allofrancisella inopinata]|uniref:Lipoprotein n=1 Tax=Allofrancisella inopinata TaxID=1085647 RepID=A0AAE7CRG0_9GAMM|nr:hypothetical protein [Allofrancisella inopinata]QIV95628.1 hypothetical protein E4K63_01775 [Allofrancisella inopinata]TDT67452.1 hypothetical protein EDC55_1232 [Allofrancisella inopinata]
MKKIILGVIVISVMVLAGCIKQEEAGSSSQAIRGAFTGSGQGTALGAIFIVISTLIKFDCPGGYIIPKSLIDNPPPFNGSVNITYTGANNIRILNVQINPSITPPTGDATAFLDISTGDRASIDLTGSFAETWCVPILSAKNFTVS